MAWKEMKTAQATRRHNPEEPKLDRQPINSLPYVSTDLGFEQEASLQLDAPLAQVYYTQIATDLEEYISWHPFSL